MKVSRAIDSLRLQQKIACIVFFCSLSVALGACDSDDDVPYQAGLGFDFRTDAPTFVNFADNAEGPAFDADLAARMFGADVVCANGTDDPCIPTDLAASWIPVVNRTLSEGRSEGFAVLTLLFHLGELSPEDFGAQTVAELELRGNPALQRELAYWAATQSVPSALSDDERFDALGVIPFLAGVMHPEHPERYRLAIAVKTELGFERGHALVPFGYFRDPGEAGVYYIRVYDSNLPSKEQRLRVNTLTNEWRYEVSLGGEPLVYEGNNENGNLLYFSPVRPRVGTLRCPFGADSDTVSVASSGALQALSASVGSQAAGIEGGNVVETGGGKLVPAFAACPLCKPSSGILNVSMPSDATMPLTVTVSGAVASGTENAAVGGTINIAGANTTASVSGIKGSSEGRDQLSLSPNGDLSFQSQSGTSATVSSTTNKGGVESTVSVQVDGASTEIKITSDAQGRPTVDTSGVPVGTKITIRYASTDANGMTKSSSATVTATAGSAQVKIDPETQTYMATDTSSPEAGTCFNEKFDPAFEVGLDCGDTCAARCPAGQPCESDADCADGVNCRPDGFSKICKAPGCDDGLRNGSETDVDCGGPMCGKCVGSNAQDPPSCAVASDCDTGLCDTNVANNRGCVAKNPVYVHVNNAEVGKPFGIEVMLDGVSSSRSITPTSTDYTVSVGNAFRYAFANAFTSQPPNRLCSFRVFQNPTRTGYGATDDGARTEEVDCVSNQASLAVSLTGLPSGKELGLRATLSGGSPINVVASQNGTVPIGSATIGGVSAPFTLEVSAQPGSDNGGASEIYCSIEGSGTTYGDQLRAGQTSTPLIKCVEVMCPDPRCGTGSLNVDVTGLGAGQQLGVAVMSPAGNETVNVSANGQTQLATFSGAWQLSITAQPGKRPAGGGEEFVQCFFTGDTTSASGSLQNGQHIETVTCTATMCPDPLCAETCTRDTDCAAGNDCYCAENSGLCTGDSGTCGAGKAFFTNRTVDGMAPTGTFAVPAGCSQVYIQAWGAGGASGGDDGDFDFFGVPGGAAGYVSGVLDVAQGDIFTAWVGEGGEFAGLSPAAESPTASIGSYLGTPVSGGAGDGFYENSFGVITSYGGGGGGGLTSVLHQNSALVMQNAFVVPGGAGASRSLAGEPVASGTGGGAPGMAGLAADASSNEGGGGAGQVGGIGGDAFTLTAAPGTYGPLPTGLMSIDGSGANPARNSVPDYAACVGLKGSYPAGYGGDGQFEISGGDGCVVIRCVGQ